MYEATRSAAEAGERLRDYLSHLGGSTVATVRVRGRIRRKQGMYVQINGHRHEGAAAQSPPNMCVGP